MIETRRLSELIIDWELYPRSQPNPLHVARLVEALRAGAQFPPLVVDAQNVIIDGVHRWTAYQRVNQDGQQVSVDVREYGSNAERFADALRLNSAHGQGLTTYDQVLSIKRAETLGMSRDDAASLMGITRQRADTLLATRLTADGVVLKRTVNHFAGLTLTESQVRANRHAGGGDQVYLINQVVNLLHNGALDVSRPTVREALQRLENALSEYITAGRGAA